MNFFKDNILSVTTSLVSASSVLISPNRSTIGQGIAATYNRIGGLLTEFANQAQLPIESVLAVWSVESGPIAFEENFPILRFEVHKFWHHWGLGNMELFNRYFQFGGQRGVLGSSWTNHKYFDAPKNLWVSFHGEQSAEYQAFELATLLGGREVACLSSSFGGPQILGSNHARLGYQSAEQMFAAFAQSERWHVCGFFDFCQSHNLLDTLRQSDWYQFAYTYNGPGQADIYAERINSAHQTSRAILAGMPEAIEEFDHAAFNTYFNSRGIKYFKAHEFLFKGRSHNSMMHRGYGLNSLPPRDLWPNIAMLAQVLDRVRIKIGSPIVLASIYRNADYNAAVGGTLHSKHMDFAAVDMRFKNNDTPNQWAEALRKLRNAGVFSGCIGAHSETVHLDVRDVNADF